MFWIVLILIASIVTQGQCQYGSACRTPDKLQGICVPVASCKPVLDIFHQAMLIGGKLMDGELGQLQGLHCGIFRNVHHVCCVASGIQLNPQGLSVLQNQGCGGTFKTDTVRSGVMTSVYPWMALLIYDDPDEPYKCAGSLISDEYVLTAAHCVKGRGIPPHKVRLGEHRKSTAIDCITLGAIEICAPPPVELGFAETIIHPQYLGIYNDIALIRLERKVKFQSHIMPICLPIYDNLRAKVHVEYVVSGWGRTETGNLSDVLMVAALPRVDIASCNSLLREKRFKYELNVSHICAGGSSLVDTCTGDSGGPLGYRDMYDGRPSFVQYGLIAAGLKYCGLESVPGIYTNVSHNIQWITDHITAN